MKPDKHFPVRTDTTLGQPTHYIARCGYESDNKDEFVIPWSYKVAQVTCEGCGGPVEPKKLETAVNG